MNYKPKKHQKKGEDYFHCLVRRRDYLAKPEEAVRQETLLYLKEEKQIPLAAFQVEVELSQYSIDEDSLKESGKKRPDIIIETPDGTALAVVECKAPSVPLSYSTIIQVQDYSKILCTPFYGITNGNDLFWYSYSETKDDYLLIKDLPSYSSLLENTGYEVVELSNHSEKHENLPYIDRQFFSFIEQLDYCFKSVSAEQESSFVYEDLTITYNRDLVFEVNSNPSGQAWEGDYRRFKVLDSEGDTFHVGFAVYSNTGYLCVSINNHHSLQLYLGEFAGISPNKISFWHNGTLGGVGQPKRQEVIDFVGQHAPYLLLNNTIFLGEIDALKPYNLENNDFRNFIGRMVKYVLLREDFRAKRRK